MSFLKSLFSAGSPDRGGRRAKSDAPPVMGSESPAGRRRSNSVGSVVDAHKGLLRYMSGDSSSLRSKSLRSREYERRFDADGLFPRSNSLRSTADSGRGFFRRLSSSQTAAAAGGGERAVLAAARREEILHSVNRVMASLAQLTATALEELRQKDPEADLTQLHTGLRRVPEHVIEQLCLSLEQALFHGLYTQGFHGMLPFIDVVEGLVRSSLAAAAAAGSSSSDSSPARLVNGLTTPGRANAKAREKAVRLLKGGDVLAVLRPLLERVKEDAMLLRTPLGMARSFLRHALNDGVLDRVVLTLSTLPSSLSPFYEPDALLLHLDSVTLLATSLSALEHYSLSLDARDPCLYVPPRWPLLHLPLRAHHGPTTHHPSSLELNKEEGPIIAESEDRLPASELVGAAEKWRLPDEMEDAPLEKFRMSDAFNSSAKHLARRDRLLDSLLLRSGGNLRHYISSPPPGPTTAEEGPISTSTSGTNEKEKEKKVVVSVPRGNYLFPPGTRRREGEVLLGWPLCALVRDPDTCRMAVLQPALGVPFIFEEMLDFLHKRLDTVPQLFMSKVSTWRWSSSLAKNLLEYQEVPVDSDPYVVASTLMHTLRSLPEPLLTFERYHAFLAAARLPAPPPREPSPPPHSGLITVADLKRSSSQPLSQSPAPSPRLPSPLTVQTSLTFPLPPPVDDTPEDARHVALRGLLNDLPLEHKPTLRRLLLLLSSACRPPPIDPDHPPFPPSSTPSAQLTPQTAAQIFGPAFLRSYIPESKAIGPPPPEALAVLPLLIEGVSTIFRDVEAESHVLQAELVTRMHHVSRLVDRTTLQADERDPHTLKLLEELFRFLHRVELRRENATRVSWSPPKMTHGDHGCQMPAQHPAAPAVKHHHSQHPPKEEPDNEEFSLTSMRWETCGFVRGNLLCELGQHSLLTLECIVYYTKRFPNVAGELMFQYAAHGIRGLHVSFQAMCAQVVRVVLSLLRLLPPSDGSQVSISTFADAGCWPLLHEGHGLEEVFCASLSLLDFLHYHEVMPLDLLAVHVLEVKRQLSWALSLGPHNTQALWELWLSMRLELKHRSGADDFSSPDAAGNEEEEEKEEEGDDDDMDSVCSFQGDLEDEEVAFKIRHSVRTKVIGRSDVFKPWHVTVLEPSLPDCYQNYDWVQVYSLRRHGASVKTLFARGRRYQRTLLAVLDSQGTVMGGFVTEPWRDNRDRYYGSGETFIFTFKDGRFVKYTWTRENSYFMLSSANGIALGGGGHFGLYLDQDLSKGSSDHCKTFGSHCLAHATTFDVVAVELWGLQSPLENGVGRGSEVDGVRGLSQSMEMDGATDERIMCQERGIDR